MIGAGLGLDEICPAIKIASGGKDMVQESIKACMYFIKLAEIADLKSDAKMDPETMMALPLARMARNQGLALEIDRGRDRRRGANRRRRGRVVGHRRRRRVGARCVRQGAEIWQQDRVQGNRLGRRPTLRENDEKGRRATGDPQGDDDDLQNSTRYATYALAYGAVEGNDPWAVQYLVNGGLTEDDLKSPATSIQIVRDSCSSRRAASWARKTRKKTIRRFCPN